MRLLARQNWVAYLAAAAAVAGVTALYRFVITDINHTTLALSYLLVVLITASAYGLGPSIVASIGGVLCFNFFFLPPVGTLTIQDPQNWMALFAFLVTAVIASQLSSSARARTRDAEKRREEVWKLYQLSRAIILTPDPETAVASIVRQVVEIFDAGYCAIFVPDDKARWRRLAVACGQVEQESTEPVQLFIDRVYQSGGVILPGTGSADFEAGQALAYAPLKIGLRSTGVMVLTPEGLERETIEALAGLVALALERARFLKEVSHTEALRQSDEMKSALLASVSHDLRTPLTSIRASIDNLLQNDLDWDKETLHEFHLIIGEEVERLTQIIQDLLEMARIEAGEMRPSKHWEQLAEIFYGVSERCARSTSEHKLTVELQEPMPLVSLDSKLVAGALANLIENAAKYSPAGTEIQLRARIEGDELIVSVKDRGPGISPEEIDRVFDKFYRGAGLSVRRKPGTGMGLAIARGMVIAHGGRIWVESTPGRGATFCFALPVEQKDEAASVG
jgi:two-component system, OmpR family, sensor histidine kinase KdpD